MPSFLNLQSRNVCSLISVTLLEITTEVKPVQCEYPKKFGKLQKISYFAPVNGNKVKIIANLIYKHHFTEYKMLELLQTFMNILHQSLYGCLVSVSRSTGCDAISLKRNDRMTDFEGFGLEIGFIGSDFS